MTGRDLIFVGIGLLIAISLAGLNDFISRIDTYNKVEEEITKIGSTYNTMREQVGANTNMANQAISMTRNYLDKTDSLIRQQDSLHNQIVELRTMYNDLKTTYYNQGQSTYSYPKTNY